MGNVKGGNVQLFFKENRAPRQNEFFAATRLFKDENGDPVKWELKPLPAKKLEEIKWANTPNGSLNEKQYQKDLVIAAVVFPPLRNKDLQDSYGVKNAEDLLFELLTGNEFTDLSLKVMSMNGLVDDVDELITEAKNS